jgi:hypothetical protein
VTDPTNLGPHGPGAQDECATCGHARWRHRPDDYGQQVCTEYVDCACHGLFVELTQATRMTRVITAAGDLATEFTAFRSALTGTMQALHRLHTTMQVAGLLPEEDQPAEPAGRHHVADPLAGSLRIHGPGAHPQLMDFIHSAQTDTYRAHHSCPTCWPRPSDPTRPMCRRNADTTQTIPVITADPDSEPEAPQPNPE